MYLLIYLAERTSYIVMSSHFSISTYISLLVTIGPRWTKYQISETFCGHISNYKCYMYDAWMNLMGHQDVASFSKWNMQFFHLAFLKHFFGGHTDSTHGQFILHVSSRFSESENHLYNKKLIQLLTLMYKMFLWSNKSLCNSTKQPQHFPTIITS